ncbi:uncharacterized protein LOC119766356 [Culex quinquefasciatus]|uniref:uncharacterized protein LOC119766356 n=1 Tax=Culex quinquefasciatus TaxID=7176 RepID=UPI0018E3F2CE|nr:uncharacterized protein LOC119766356 [Culex quinquefasciatus]
MLHSVSAVYDHQQHYVPEVMTGQLLPEHPEEQFALVLEGPSVRKPQVLELSYSDYFQRLERDPTNLIKNINLEYRRSYSNSRPQTLISQRRSFGRMNFDGELAISVSFSKEDEVIVNYPFMRFTS